MERHKLESAALFLTIFGALLIMPPLVSVSRVGARLLGVPLEVVYFFAVWAGLVAGAWWLSRRMPRDRPAGLPEDEP